MLNMSNRKDKSEEEQEEEQEEQEEQEQEEEQEEQEEQEDFYDCEETLQHLHLRGGEDEGAAQNFTTNRLKETEGERLKEEEELKEEEQEEKLWEEQEQQQQEEKLWEEQEEKLWEEQQEEQQQQQEEKLWEEQQEEQQQQQEEKLREEQQEEQQEQDSDSDSELREKVECEPEFDDENLQEVEKELTEEEKESRRLQSLSVKERGNKQFKSGEWAEAELSYKEALVLCPVCFSRERAVLFSNRAAARLHLDMKDAAIADCTRAIELNPEYVRALLRRAELYEATEKLDEALEDYKKVLDLDPNQTSARQACMRLPVQIQERNEKLKEEMLGKLKDLGNLVLRPFGLSTNNFQVNQDSETGSYSINFIQNPNNNNNNNNNT